MKLVVSGKPHELRRNLVLRVFTERSPFRAGLLGRTAIGPHSIT